MPESVTIRISGQTVDQEIYSFQLDQSVDDHHVLKIRLHGLEVDGSSGRFPGREARVGYLGQSLALSFESDEVPGESGPVTSEFVGVVTEVTFDHRIDGSNICWITAHSPTIAMDGACRNRLFHEMTASDIISSIVGDYSITVGSIEATSATKAYCVQYQETDYEFVQRLANEAGLHAYYDGQRFQVMKAAASGDTPSITYGYDLRVFTMGLGTTAEKYGSEVYDVAKKEVIAGETSGSLGASLSSTAAKSHDASKDLYTKGSFVSGLKADSQGDLDRSLATAREAAVSSMFTCTGRCHLRWLKLGQCIDVESLGEMLSARYWVKSVRHVFGYELTDARGLNTQSTGDDTDEEFAGYYNRFTCLPLEAAYPRRRSAKPRLADLQPAVVTSTDDPDELGRVQVKFFWNDGSSLAEPQKWLRVLTPHGGNERGFFCLPEVDDEVLVAFEHGDPDRPIVLGSMYNGMDKAPVGHSAGFSASDNDLKLFRTKSGNEIFFHDGSGAETISIVQKDGENAITMDMSGPSITIESASGDITIKGATITLESTTGDVTIKSAGALKLESTADAEIKAGVNFKAEGSVNAEIKGGAMAKLAGTQTTVEGSAMTDIKGAIVKIN